MLVEIYENTTERDILTSARQQELSQCLLTTAPRSLRNLTSFQSISKKCLSHREAPALDLASETEEEKRNRLNKRHAPKNKRGTRCIDDETIDRSPAILDKPGPSKLVVRFKTEEIDECSDKLIQGYVEF
ncbi:hypothetical protein BPAE_0405g00010 [Botrytis paeoniae]|uniref:Uncharacterized protein n=1 Tax=Botrytis paeoniae TaxID=278948 RepID=A0A4Z1F2X8_9HELO|nr:hypothetical protein BPAE_0405g00010 [Botrytis paeoniae]